MRTFDHFPKDSICKLCGTNDDKECILVPVQGTEEDGICEAIPVHIDCVKLIYWPEENIFYQRGFNPLGGNK